MMATNPGSLTNPSIFQDVQVINIGLEEFYISLKEQNIRIIHVSWSPPAGGDQDVIDLLDLVL